MKKHRRGYVKTARAESEAETRARIVEATVALHEELGPARTTIKAIAERAGVQRLTVYRHFPNDTELFAACSGLWGERNPLPDPASIDGTDPRRRTRELLLALYRFYRGGRGMLTSVFADAPHDRTTRATLAPMLEAIDALVEPLERGWPRRSAHRRATLRHAVQFTTWQSLAELTDDDQEAVDLVMRWCDGTQAFSR